MTRKALLLAATFILTACHSPGHPVMTGVGTKANPCGTPVCKVTITVTDGCVFKFDPPDHLYIAAADKNMQIHWELTGAKFIDDNSVYLKKPAVNDPPELVEFKKLNDGEFQVKNKHAIVGKLYEYGVKVDRNGTICGSDPWIDN